MYQNGMDTKKTHFKQGTGTDMTDYKNLFF